MRLLPGRVELDKTKKKALAVGTLEDHANHFFQMRMFLLCYYLFHPPMFDDPYEK